MSHRQGCRETSGLAGCGGDFDDTGGGGGASTREIIRCKAACQKQKFFGFYTAQQHDACFNKCARANAGKIQTFAACVGTDTCDAECGLDVEININDGNNANNDPDPNNSSSTPCVKPCERLKKDGCGQSGAVDCQQICAQADESQKKALNYCESARNGCEFPPECQGTAGGGAALCKQACSSMSLQGCLPQADVSTCQTRWGEISDDQANGFVPCVNSGIWTDDSCYAQISDGGAGADVTGCQTTCDDMKDFDCLDATQHSECRTVCEDASKIIHRNVQELRGRNL